MTIRQFTLGLLITFASTSFAERIDLSGHTTGLREKLKTSFPISSRFFDVDENKLSIRGDHEIIIADPATLENVELLNLRDFLKGQVLATGFRLEVLGNVVVRDPSGRELDLEDPNVTAGKSANAKADLLKDHYGMVAEAGRGTKVSKEIFITGNLPKDAERYTLVVDGEEQLDLLDLAASKYDIPEMIEDSMPASGRELSEAFRLTEQSIRAHARNGKRSLPGNPPGQLTPIYPVTNLSGSSKDPDALRALIGPLNESSLADMTPAKRDLIQRLIETIYKQNNFGANGNLLDRMALWRASFPLEERNAMSQKLSRELCKLIVRIFETDASTQKTILDHVMGHVEWRQAHLGAGPVIYLEHVVNDQVGRTPEDLAFESFGRISRELTSTGVRVGFCTIEINDFTLSPADRVAFRQELKRLSASGYAGHGQLVPSNHVHVRYSVSADHTCDEDLLR